jgi:circadian clock protein KaiC
MSGEWHARVEVGIPGFDELVHGGLPRGRSTLLAGSTGTGKTVFGLQFLVSGARRGEHGVIVTFAERPEDLVANVESFGWDLDRLVRERRLAIVDATPTADTTVSGRFDLAGLSARIAHALNAIDGTRLFLDPIDALFEEFDAAVEVRREFAAMLRQLRPLSATTLIAAERPNENGTVTRYGAEEFAVDNVILVRNVRARRSADAARSRSSSCGAPTITRASSRSSSTRGAASRSCRSPRSRAAPPDRPSGSRSETPSSTRCAAAGCTAMR